jgi:hypothetical protein
MEAPIVHPLSSPVTTLTILFIILSLLSKLLYEKIHLFTKSNIKYRIINSLSPYIYYGPNLGVEAVLRLDSPSEDVVKRRLDGHRYLASKLLIKSNTTTTNGEKKEFKGGNLAASLVDCRFALAKVCMPLLRELEFDGSGRNYVVNVVNSSCGGSDEDGAAGMLTVQTETDFCPFVGSDAVHTFGTKVFYEPIQREIGKRMEQGDLLRFCPTVMNGALERNVELIKRLTGLDQVSSSFLLFFCVEHVQRYMIRDCQLTLLVHAKF